MSNNDWFERGELPPMGTVCEAAIPHTSGPDNELSHIWIEGRVIAYHEIKGKTYAWFSEDDGFYPPNVLEFRPIRTERDNLIEIIRSTGWVTGTACDGIADAILVAGFKRGEE